ncbi:MAG: bifunctional phosphopantothenoylcysteine decarboxylase/phosphopantothenate--cysteine ligase CoaBC [Acidimicrobiia bacterium]|nr:bifunctional phosphopantothenoylcysteine decarboxylase/phosphopantothenate--cysteine ligase CoaBC [Acidimicrobiia bacterium]
MLTGRRILLGVTGGVAAYKAAYLARRLVESGAQVRTIMTQSALEFLGPQTLAAITGTRPAVDMFGQASVSPHIEMAHWAEAVVVAPATASSLSRIANGLSEDLLSATILAATVPVVVAPAMHTEMWMNPATVRNMTLIRRDGRVVVGPGTGALAGGDEGRGRMSEPEEILAAVVGLFSPGPLAGRKVLITAGGTREPVDPVRYIGNRSSGKMGNAIARSAARMGAEVTLVTTVAPPGGPMVVIEVETAEQMAAVVWERAPGADVAVLAAAVADFRPAGPSGGKLARTEGPPEIELEATPDILRGLAAMEGRPFLVGFAAETGPVEDAIAKGKHQRTDLLVANDVGRDDSGFGTDTNQVSLVMPDGSVEAWPVLTKDEVADRLWERIAALLPGGAS